MTFKKKMLVLTFHEAVKDGVKNIWSVRQQWGVDNEVIAVSQETVQPITHFERTLFFLQIKQTGHYVFINELWRCW